MDPINIYLFTNFSSVMCVGIDQCWAQASTRLRNQLKLSGPRDLGHAHFQGKLFMRLLGIPNTKPPTKFEVSSSSSFGDMFDRMPKLYGSRDLGHAHFQVNYLCASSAFPIQSRIPNSKALAQVAFEILRSKRIGITSLTFQGHVTSSVT